MKNKLICSVLLWSSFWLQAPLLTNQLLKTLDAAGIFNESIYDIIVIRQKVKELVKGEFIWKGAQCNLSIVDEQDNSLPAKLHIILKRPETIFGATFVIISPEHPQ